MRSSAFTDITLPQGAGLFKGPAVHDVRPHTNPGATNTPTSETCRHPRAALP